MNKLVTLLTDFGWRDPYLAEMKASLYAEWDRFGAGGPNTVVLDLCHDLPPCDVGAASWFLGRVHRRFPGGTVHLAVVDPGVGTERPLIAAAARGQHFVGPGNGLFDFLRTEPGLEVVALENPLYFRPTLDAVAATFHGRDIMGPVAAHLAAGVPLRQVGSPGGADLLGRLDCPGPATAPGTGLLGHVVWVDRFGNAITDIEREGEGGAELEAGAAVRLGGVEVPGPYHTFAAGPVEGPFWYWGSGGTVEAGQQGGGAADRFGWRRGLAVTRAGP